MLASGLEDSSSELGHPWIQGWADLVDFEVVPVRTSAEAAQIMRGET